MAFLSNRKTFNYGSTPKNMKLFVWDFHGVLEKGNEGAVLEVSNTVLANFGYSERFTLEDCHRLYGKRWVEYFQDLLPEEDSKKLLELQESCFAMGITCPEIVARHIKPNDYSHEVLEAVSKKHSQILISNTNPESLIIFLDSVGVTPYFPNGTSFAIDNHRVRQQRTKQGALNDFVASAGQEFESIITIGDSPADMEIVRPFKGVSYLYSHPGRPFRDCKSDYKINSLREILKEI